MLGLSVGTLEARPKEHKKPKESVTFLVSMSCGRCQQRIEEHLAFEKGVTNVRVDLPQKTVHIEYQPDKTSPDKLRNSIKKLGYTVKAHPAKTEKKDEHKEKRKPR